MHFTITFPVLCPVGLPVITYQIIENVIYFGRLAVVSDADNSCLEGCIGPGTMSTISVDNER